MYTIAVDSKIINYLNRYLELAHVLYFISYEFEYAMNPYC